MPQHLDPNETYISMNHHTPLQQALKSETETQEEIINLPQNLYDGLCTPDEAARIRFREQSWQKDR